MKHTWHDAINSWSMTYTGKSAKTRALRVYQLRRLAEVYTDPWIVNEDDLLKLLDRPDWSSESKRSYRSAFRSFYRWAHRRGHIAADPAADLPPIESPTVAPRPAPQDVINDALTGADDRVRLMIALAASEGLRRGEIAQVHSNDLVQHVSGKWLLRVHGKGSKQRMVPLQSPVAAALRALPEGWAFPGRIDGHLSPEWVGKLVRRRMPDAWSTHTLRHRFATVVYAGTRDILLVGKLLGHARTETTQRYVQLVLDEAMWDAVRHAA